MQRAEHAQKHFLRKVEGFFAITQQVRGQAQNEAMMLEDQRRVCRFVAREAALD